MGEGDLKDQGQSGQCLESVDRLGHWKQRGRYSETYKIRKKILALLNQWIYIPYVYSEKGEHQ